VKVSFLAPALDEFLSGIRYYNNQRSGLGEEFQLAVDEALQVVMQFPFGIAPEADRPHLRIKPVRRFPYGVVYEVLKDEIVVHAVMHLHRRPGYWHDR